MKPRDYRIGDPVIFRKEKVSVSPGPRATDVNPAARGEQYSYRVPKFWRVIATRGDCVLVRTRKGKRHVLDAANQFLRPASWWERLRYRRRFPATTDGASASTR